MEKVANHVKKYRLKCNLTQWQLAYECGVRVQTINNIENGRVNASLPIAIKIYISFAGRLHTGLEFTDVFYLVEQKKLL